MAAPDEFVEEPAARIQCCVMKTQGNAELDADVVVVGAGMAGLAAARTLAEAGVRVLLVEASRRVGGRIHTVRAGGAVVELGAEFLHGRPAALWRLIDEAGLETYERTGDALEVTAPGEFTRSSDEDAESSASDAPDAGAGDPLEALKSYTGPDQSFLQFLDAHCPQITPEQRARAIGYVEGFNAADANEASILALAEQQRAEDAIEGDRVWRIREGYDRLPAFLHERLAAAGASILFHYPVERIAWTPGKVRVYANDGRSLAAKHAIVSLPLGVLQAGAVRFEPPPENILDAAARMRMGRVCRFTFVFAKQMWPAEMSFLLTPEVLPNVWWTAHPAESRTLTGHSLTGWAGGPRSESLLALDDDALKQHALQSLAHVLGLSTETLAAGLVSFHTHDWQRDPLSRGAYTWVPAGALGASRVMSEPVADTLFFAGEHTDTTGHWGTVHAAYGSGLRAAAQVLAAYRGATE